MYGRIMVGFVVRCHQSVNTIGGRIMVRFVVVVSLKTQHVLVKCLGVLLLSFDSKHTILSYYGCLCRTLSSVSKHNKES